MLQRISELINRHRTFLVTAHERLDGDALGSELALYHLLRGLGKEAVVYNQDATPENYEFLPGSDSIVNELPPWIPLRSPLFSIAANWSASGESPRGSLRFPP